MQLAKIEIHGFKSFANKAVLDFVGTKHNTKTMTAIVGPNGSGKSNTADAIRWALGEQSMKMLRGKKSEDVIFAGSEKKGKLGLAEVTLYIENPDASYGIDMSEIVITRRLYRSGESEYLLNNKPTRLLDVALLLARAHFGQRTYSVIGQGMIDHILVATPTERKEFFDEAAGVREFQIKRHQAMLKITQTQENLSQAQTVVNEIEPRLKSLKRQVTRLEERAEVESALKILQTKYFSQVWGAIFIEHKKEQKDFFALDTKLKDAEKRYNDLSRKMAELEKSETGEDNSSMAELQRQYEDLIKQQNKIHESIIRLKSEREISRVRSEVNSKKTTLPLSEIISGIKKIREAQRGLFKDLSSAKSMTDVSKILEQFEALESETDELLTRIESPAGEFSVFKLDPKIEASLEEMEKSRVILEEKIMELSGEMKKTVENEKEKKSEFFELQRKLRDEQSIRHSFETQLGDIRVKLARIDARREQIEEELFRELPQDAKIILHNAKISIEQNKNVENNESTELMLQEIYSLKKKIEFIGGIDPEVIKEHKEIEERYNFLTGQINDLSVALENLFKIVMELDATMKEKRDIAFKEINREFDRYFRMLFNGGKAELMPIFLEPRAASDEEEDEDEFGEDEQEKIDEAALGLPNQNESKVFAGVEIRAVPPGKRINSINTLSGGERALVSIALLCAIINSNPSPFVVLDEVDAALDESNSIRFAEILKELSTKTQVIAITHNRATMHQADFLYGVTMGTDGVSALVSVKMEEAIKHIRN